jgi:hypothetical protein
MQGDNHHDWREEMTYQQMAADVLHFCDTQGMDQVELIGHSVGGKVAQYVRVYSYGLMTIQLRVALHFCACADTIIFVPVISLSCFETKKSGGTLATRESQGSRGD